MSKADGAHACALFAFVYPLKEVKVSESCPGVENSYGFALYDD